MKQFLQILIFLCFATVAYAQNTTEPKMAYQMAEEKFDAKQYTEALDYLEKAETALGNTNPPMLFLKVMITNQIVTAKESTDNYWKLEKAITDFDKHKDKNALGEDKLMDVYRIKVDLDKRIIAYKKKLEVEIEYYKMLKRLEAEFPKTKINLTVSEFMDRMHSWWKPLTKEERKQLKKEKKEIFNINGYYYTNIQPKHFFFKSLNSEIGWYSAEQLLTREVKDKSERAVSLEELCELLEISKQMWDDLTTGNKPLISIDDSIFEINYTQPDYEKDTDGEYKGVWIAIDKRTKITEYGEFLQIQIRRNNL